MRVTCVRISLLIVAVLLVVCAQAGAQCVLPAWSAGADYTIDVYSAGVASDGTFVYAAGGYSWTGGGSYITDFGRYDPAANTWTPLAPLPPAQGGAPLVFNPNDNKLYLFGGVGGTSVSANTWIYDIATDVWTAGPPLPGPRQQMAGGFFNGLIYLVAGYDSTAVTPQSQNWEFDPAAGTFTARADLPSTLGGPAFVAADGLFYIIGGRDIPTSNLSTVYAYDPAGDSWSTLASLPVAINSAAAVQIPGPGSDPCAGDLVVTGGGDPVESGSSVPVGADDSRTTAQTQIYDIATNTWSLGPNLTQGRSFVGAANVDDQLVVIGGHNGSGSVATVDIINAPVPVGLQSITVE